MGTSITFYLFKFEFNRFGVICCDGVGDVLTDLKGLVLGPSG